MLLIAVVLWLTGALVLADPLVVTSRLVDSPVHDILWVTDDVVFLLTEKNSIYRSTNAGQDWVSQSHAMLHHKSGVSSTDPIKINSFIQSEADGKVLFFIGLGGENWITLDMGNTYQPAGEVKMSNVRLHPTNSAYILGSTMTDACTNKKAPGSCFKVLTVSHDFGATWKSILNYVVQYDWSPPGRAVDHENTIFVTAHIGVQEGNQKFGAWDTNIHFLSSSDAFKTYNTLVRHGNRFLFGDFGYLFVAAVKPNHVEEVTLQVATGNSTLHFETATLPVELSEHSYTILDASEGTVFLHVNHAAISEHAQEGMVYVSDSTGLTFSKSLPYNHRAPDGKCDFEKIYGMEGIYIANFVESADPEYIDVESEEQMFEGGDNWRHTGPTHVKTVITFDKGAEWRYIPVPPLDSNGHPWACTSKHCHLHLHGITDTEGPVYSTNSATGLIMATGVVANYLHQHDLANTFFSRDSGLTWTEVAKGSHIYEFGDRGGLVVMAKDSVLTQELMYSWDEGLTWGVVEIGDEPFMVDNIITDPESLSQEFVIYGYAKGRGVVIQVDFSGLHERQCTGHQDPSLANSDYEYWSPSDGRLNGKCLLGHTVSYLRRKQSSQCFNPDPFDRLVEKEHCQCVADDFECDYGYERNEGEASTGEFVEGTCVAVEDLSNDPYSHDCEDGRTSRRVTLGYRRVPFDTCLNGEQWDVVEIACPSSVHTGKLILVLLCLVAGALLMVFFGNKINCPCKLSMSEYHLLGGPGRNIDTPDDVFYLDEEDSSASLIDTYIGGGPALGTLPVLKDQAAAVPKISGPRFAA